MKNRWLILLLTSFCMQYCTAQSAKNPAYLGANFGKFDVDKIDFKENVDTLFSKANGGYKRTEKDEATNNIIGYQYYLSIKKNTGTKIYFIDENFNDVRAEFVVDKNNVFSAVTLTVSRPTSIDLLSQIRKKYGKYEVKLKQTNAHHNYQWDTPQKYISLSFTDKMGDEGYMYYVLITEKGAADRKFPTDRFSNPIHLCLDASCKE